MQQEKKIDEDIWAVVKKIFILKMAAQIASNQHDGFHSQSSPLFTE